MIDSYYQTGNFDFSMMKHGKIIPDHAAHQQIYSDYQKYLRQAYHNENTIHFYEYEMFCLLQYLNQSDIFSFNQVVAETIIKYLTETKLTRQREALCGLRGIFRYLDRDDLACAIAGVHAPYIKRIIPTLSDEEIQKIKNAIMNGTVSKRDTAIVIIGLSCGIRACDLIKLRLSDIDWENETITFIQSKTGNQVCLPLTVAVGNAIADYLSEERPDAEEEKGNTIAPLKPCFPKYIIS